MTGTIFHEDRPIEEIAKSGAQVRGIVIWNMEHPKMPALKRADEVQQEMVVA